MMKRWCNCGQPIWINYRWNGAVHRVEFQDAEGNEIDACPGCGQSVTAWLKLGETRLELNDVLLREEPTP